MSELRVMPAVAAGVPITTFTGRTFYPLAPKPESIVIEDIAHHLSLLNRFVGATREPYSVAQHSIYVSMCCDQEDALHGLLHDASEAYLGDVSRPLKGLGLLRPYRAIEAQLQAVIYCRFGLAPEMPSSVKLMDDRILVTEMQDLFAPDSVPIWALHKDRLALAGVPIRPWPAWSAEKEFLRRFTVLAGGSR